MPTPRPRRAWVRVMLAVVLVLVVAGAGWSFAAEYVGQPGAAEDLAVTVAPGGGPRAGSRAAADAKRRPKERQRKKTRDAGGERPAAPIWSVTRVMDGDTIVVARDGTGEEHVRLIGIDTPERGVCGYGEASAALTAAVLHRDVELSPGATSDRDRYGRLLRYADLDGVDAGLGLIDRGLAVARYDSRDGYGRHPREEAYVTADGAAVDLCQTGTGQPQGQADGSQDSTGSRQSSKGSVAKLADGAVWSGCNEARAAGAAPVYRGDPGYAPHLDGDGDGVGCE